MLAVGYPQEGFDPDYSSLSMDGGRTWNLVYLSGLSVAEDSFKRNTSLFPDGRLYYAAPSGLNLLGLKSPGDGQHRQRLRPYPPSFKPLAMARRDRTISVIGSLPERGFGIWYTRADGTGGESLHPAGAYRKISWCTSSFSPPLPPGRIGKTCGFP